MVAIKRLSEAEAMTAAILLDDTGIDLAEFAFVDESREDRCTRLRPYQWWWFVDDSKHSVSACGRDVGKTFRIIIKACAHPYSNPGTDFFITAPGADHLRPVVNAIEEKILSVKFLKALLRSGFGKTGISRIPSFEARFKNHSHIITRLPKLTGTGLKGIHALKVVVDEAQDMPDVWSQLWPTMRRELPNSRTELYGVTVGLGDTFDKLATDADSSFKVWRKIAPERPDWDDIARKEAIGKYGSESSIRYSQNIFGVSAGIYSDLLVTARLMACVRNRESEWACEYNQNVYLRVTIDDDRIGKSGIPPEDYVQLPQSHLDECYFQFWTGWDLGFTQDPSEMLTFGALTVGEKTIFRLLSRISMRGISTPDQIKVACKVIDFFGGRYVGMGLDGTGPGVPFKQTFDKMKDYREKVRGYGFGEKLVVGWEDRKLRPKERLKDIEIKMSVPEYGLSQLRKLVDAGRLELPLDTDLLGQWQGVGEDHVLHAAYMFCVARDQADVAAKRAALSSYVPPMARIGF